MNKNKKNSLIIFIAILIVYNIIFFTLPSIKTGSFWVSYIFGMVAIVLNLGIIKFAWEKAKTIKSKFMGVPILIVGYRYAAIQLILSSIFLILNIIPAVSENLKEFKIPYYIPLIIDSIIFIICIISVLIVDVARDEINRVEENIKEKVFYIKDLQVEVELLADHCEDNDSKVALLSLAEKIRYSDPMTDESLSDLEAQIKQDVEKLVVLNKESILQQILEIEKLISQRNKRCKVLK